ncbi:mechanosensitive ion channel family protein [Fastidiosibacter lacustris]|uniref:mechanosensitive ion channel family protein n=1 Tax=Fastidiosibacter lacustris TaxID=2056695 RepID=UPI000E34109F|nr:mechanosensitive ion channel domain-containing protein [Fastidiosibacter lacustris]
MEMSIQNFNQYFQWLLNLILEYLPQIVIAIIILVVGLIAAKIIKNNTQKVLFKTRLDKAVTMFLMQIMHVFLVIFVILIALNTLGISTTPFTAGIAAVLVGIGMSLRTSANIVVSGIMIVSTRPFKIGEFVDLGGTSGTVESISFVFCTLRTTDGREIKVPNSLVTSRIITNFSNNEFRRNDFIIGIGYSSDLLLAKKLLQQLVDQNEKIIKIDDKQPIVRVDALGDNSVNLIVRYWTNRADYFETKWHLNESVKLCFDENNIEIPFPQRTVHIANTVTTMTTQS